MASSLEMCGLYQLGICAMIVESDWYFSSCGDGLIIISSDFDLCFMRCGGGGLKCGTLLWCTAVGLSRRGAGRGGLPPLAVPDPPPNIIWDAIGFLTRGLGTGGCIVGGWEWLCRWPGWSGSYILNDCKCIAIIMHVRISYVCTWHSRCRVYSYIQNVSWAIAMFYRSVVNPVLSNKWPRKKRGRNGSWHCMIARVNGHDHSNTNQPLTVSEAPCNPNIAQQP